jgi:hypothetical protein
MTSEIVIGAITFALLGAASFASVSLCPRLRAVHGNDETTGARMRKIGSTRSAPC